MKDKAILIPTARRTFPELVAHEIPAPRYTKPHEPIDYARVIWLPERKNLSERSLSGLKVSGCEPDYAGSNPAARTTL